MSDTPKSVVYHFDRMVSLMVRDCRVCIREDEICCDCRPQMIDAFALLLNNPKFTAMLRRGKHNEAVFD